MIPQTHPTYYSHLLSPNFYVFSSISFTETTCELPLYFLLFSSHLWEMQCQRLYWAHVGPKYILPSNIVYGHC